MTHILTKNSSLLFENLFCCLYMCFFWLLVTYIWPLLISYNQETNLSSSMKEKRHWSQPYNYYFRYTCLLHSTFLIIMGLYTLYENGLTFGVPYSDLGVFGAKLSLCFYLVDLVRREYFRDNVIDNPGRKRFHHTVVIIMIISSLFPVAYTHQLFFATLTAEVSAPFRLLRELLKFHGEEGSKLHKDLGFGFAFSFIVPRIILSPMIVNQFYGSIKSVIVKSLYSLMIFYAWHLMFVMINWCAKTLQENSELSEGIGTETYSGMIHKFLTNVRKNSVFMGVYYLFGGVFSFGPLLLLK